MIAAAFFFAAMGICVKAATATNTASQAIFFRALTGLPFLLWWARRRGIAVWGTRQRKLLVLRGTLGLIALTLYFHSIARIPIGNAAILNAGLRKIDGIQPVAGDERQIHGTTLTASAIALHGVRLRTMKGNSSEKKEN